MRRAATSAGRLLMLAAGVAACARHPAAPAPAPVAAPAQSPARAAPAETPAPDLSGSWSYVANLNGTSVEGTLTLARSGTTYTGSATASTASELMPVTSVSLAGAKLTLTLDTPNGPAALDAVVSGGTVIVGTVYVAELSGPFRARKR